jgi:hypothetical protein
MAAPGLGSFIAGVALEAIEFLTNFAVAVRHSVPHQ